jgi:ATP-binding cassette subfamily C protein CydC
MTPDRRLLALLRPVRRDAVLGALLAAATLVAGIALIGSATYLISRAAVATLFVEVAVLVALVRGLAIARAALRYGERYLTHRATLGLLATLRAATFRALEPRLPALAASSTTGDLLARLGPDIDAMDRAYLAGIVPPFAASVAGVVAVVAVAIAAPVAALVLAGGLLLAAGLAPIVRRLSRAGAERLVEQRADLHAAIADDIAGAAELIAFEATAGFDARFGRAADSLRRTERHQAWLRGLAEGATAAVGAGTALGVLAISIAMVGAGTLDPLLLAVLPLVALAAFEGVQPLAASMDQLEESRAAASRVFALADTPVPVPEPALSAAPVLSAAPAQPAALAQAHTPAIALERVTFRYEPTGRPVLSGLSFEVPAGGRLAVRGPSGAGKSTLVDLVVRFLGPSDGTIRLGGLDVATLAGDEVRAAIAVVPQRPYLFHGTLRDNLLVADGDASDDALLQALAFAGLAGPLATAAGLGSIVGEDGARLSGGERERVAIARMVLKDSPVVVLDEATAHLDPASERAMVERLDAYLRGRTAIVLAHRSALLELASERLDL